ncbi:hypothetical protein JW824_13690 [bacterium]|nr:hypothetical protein [bacterium]
MKKPKRPRDINQRTKQIVAIATDDGVSEVVVDNKNPHAVALGRLGGLKGGKARAKALTPKQRSEIAKKAAKTRWSNKTE